MHCIEVLEVCLGQEVRKIEMRVKNFVDWYRGYSRM
jgi:hypothetical protein